LRAIGFWGLAALWLGAACSSSHSAPGEPVDVGGECARCGGESGAAFGASGGAQDGGSAGLAEAGAGAGGVGDAEATGGVDSAAGQAGVGGAPPPDIELRALSIYQSLEIPLMRAGAELPVLSRAVPLIAGKRALVRAFVDIVPPFRERPLLGVLDLDTGQTIRSLLSQREIAGSSTRDDFDSSFVFEVAADDLTPASSYRLRVLEADTTPIARFPETGYAELGPRSLPSFELVLVPFVVSGFAPKLGVAELTALRKRLLGLYPSVGVDITVAPAVTLGYAVDADAGWDEALDELYTQRADAKPAHDVFYFGLMAPAPSYEAFCPDGCTVGYSVVADPSDVDSRGGIGIGVFADGSGSEDAWDTVAHELGHALGRAHAPCPAPPSPDRPDGIDSRWPSDLLHKSAALGVDGYDFDTAELVKLELSKDVMSYCTPVWISDYTYAAIYKRLDYIKNESFKLLEATLPESFRLARITRDGRAHWLGEWRKQGRAALWTLSLLDADGHSVGQVEAQVGLIDHAPGAYVWLPTTELGVASAVSVDLRPLGGGLLAL
jgi:hypothetical protein